MATTKAAASSTDLREFIKENDQRLYDFCYYMLDGYQAEDVLLSACHDFGPQFRRLAARRGDAFDPKEARLLLFQIAWNRIRDALTQVQFEWTQGRDTRQFKGFDEDLLKKWDGKKDLSSIESHVVERLGRVDTDFRAPLVLRDILGFGDEEVIQILGIRWGVFRHRLHRGRLEFKDGLRGRLLPQTQSERSV